MVSLEETRRVWSRAAKFPANKELVYAEHAIVQEFDQHKGKRVLEYGCGGGSDALSYLRRGCTVWYVDVVQPNVEAAIKRIASAGLDRKAYGLTLESSADIPVGDGYFQVVNSHGVLHHIEDPLPVLKEFRRLLARDGLLYVMLYSEALWAKFKPTVDALIKSKRCKTEEEAFGWCTDGEGVPYARYYTDLQGKDLLKSAGFSLVSDRTYVNGEFRTFKAVRV